jgi:ABC-2 type transport system ATP-binding protein
MIQCEDLTKYFDTFRAVEGVTLNVEPGEVLAILGQNGAGKTTTVRMLTSVLTPTRGWARVAGYDVITQAQQVRASVGVLTENHGLYMRMTANEYLDFFGQAYGLSPEKRKSRTGELLEYFGLAAAAKRKSGEYSKGMRQKLALARALIHEPPVLLLDEPTSAMDPESAQLVRTEIARLRSSQRSIILCTHNLAEAETLADKIAIIYRGRVLLTGSIDDLRLQLLGPTEYEVTLAGEITPTGLEAVDGLTLTSSGLGWARYTTNHPERVNPAIIRHMVAQNAPVVSLGEVSRTLEVVYLKAMSLAAEGKL